MAKKKKTLKLDIDIVGAKSISKTAQKVTDAAIKGMSAFLSRICLPVAREFGLLLQDRVHAWRAPKVVAITQQAEEKMKENQVPVNNVRHRICPSCGIDRMNSRPVSCGLA